MELNWSYDEKNNILYFDSLDGIHIISAEVYNEIETKIENLESENSKLTEQLDQMRQSSNDFESQVENLKAENDRLNKQNSDMVNEVMKVSVKLVDAGMAETYKKLYEDERARKEENLEEIKKAYYIYGFYTALSEWKNTNKNEKNEKISIFQQIEIEKLISCLDCRKERDKLKEDLEYTRNSYDEIVCNYSEVIPCDEEEIDNFQKN